MDFTFLKSQITHLLKPSQKFVVMQKGRRYGFTIAASNIALLDILKGKAKRILWGDVTYNNVNNYYRNYFLPKLKELGKSGVYYEYNKSEHNLLFHDGEIHFRSAEYPESWEGLGYDLIILNEAGIILKDEYLYKNSVLPMMIDNPNSRLIAGGVPKGKTYRGKPHPFYELCQRAIENKNGEYYHSKVTTWDNYKLSRDSIQTLIDEIGNPTKISQEIMGEFVDEVNNPYAWAFDSDKHVAHNVERANGVPVYLSFDFNVNPMTCIAVQIFGRKVNIFKEYRLTNSNIYELCEKLRAEYKGVGLIVTGDSTGRNRNAAAKKNTSSWNIIQEELALKNSQIKVPSVNPHFDNAYIKVNQTLRDYDFKISKKCNFLINDLELVDYDTFKNHKTDLGDMGHLLDCFKYFCFNIL